MAAIKQLNHEKNKSSSINSSSSNNNNNKSRVCIKNLPPSCNESDLKSHLNSSSLSSIIITDCKILRTKDGKSRKLAFVGFKTPEMAQDVVSYFHKTYLGTSRLGVELAFSKDTHDNSNRPWSKYSLGSSRHDALHKVETFVNKNCDGKDRNDTFTNDIKSQEIDKKKEEFLAVMMGSKRGNSTNKMWSNDDGMNTDFNEGAFIKEKHDDCYDSDTSSSSSRSYSSSSSDSSNEDDGKNKVKNEEELDSEQNDGIDNLSSALEFSSDRLFVRNLPFQTTEEEVKEVFSSFGDVIECHIPVDDSNRNKGYAFVKFANSNDASQAKQQLDGSPFQGRLIHVLPAKPERDNKDNSKSTDERISSTYKKRMEIARQKGGTEANDKWSANFVRGDAVVDNLADRFQIDKGAMFNVKDELSSGNAAVRLALGETQILEENRDFFRQFGIQMDSIELSKGNDSITRSNSMILVKNLPYDTTKDDLSKLFLSGGAEADILLPPSRTIALLEYKKPVDARRAFRKLSYKRFKHVPLYLEWAPVSIKIQSNSKDDSLSETSSGKITTEIRKDDDGEGHGDSLSSTVKATSIYVKNLNFSTSESDIWKAFEQVIGTQLRSVRIPLKSAPIKSINDHQPNDNVQVHHLSMGYGFVECCSEEAATKAIEVLQGQHINGYAMELKISSNSKSNKRDNSTIISKNCTKLIVRNVPFQASRKDLLQLFGSFGQLKTVRLPKKFDGGHRGFAFVEFTVAKEAQHAMKGLSQTHLYGRHLIIEWADEGETSEKRDGTSMLPETKGRNKKIRFE